MSSINEDKSKFNRKSGLALVQSFYNSGQKPKIFCADNNISYHILQYWRNIYNKNQAKKVKLTDNNNFLPVKIISEPRSSINVVVNGNISIEIHENSNLNLFKQVIAVCSSCG